MILFSCTDNQGILLGDRESKYQPWALLSGGSCFPVDMSFPQILAQSPQSSPRWSPAFKIQSVLFPSSVYFWQELKVQPFLETVWYFHTFTVRRSRSAPRCLPKRNESIYSNIDLYTNVHNTFICKSHKLENPNAHQQKQVLVIHMMNYCSL